MDLRRCAAGASLLLLACGGGDAGPTGPDPGTGPDIDFLFAPPTAAELAAVEAEWAARSPRAADVRTEQEQEIVAGNARAILRIVSHVVDGERHFGAILAPADAPAGRTPVLVYLHGGDQGTDVSELFQVIAAGGFRIDEFVYVQPSFRSERLSAAGLSWVSGGEPSPWDRDVDDALALLDVALETAPAADAGRIAALGFSRGGGVALLMGVRDPRVGGVVEFFGPTDFLDQWVRDIVDDVLAGRTRELPGLNALADQWIRPFHSGHVTATELRHQMLLRSPARFAARLPATQVHHGTADPVVPVSQAERLVAAMDAIGRTESSFEAFLYTGGDHNPFTLGGSIERATAFLRDVPAHVSARR